MLPPCGLRYDQHLVNLVAKVLTVSDSVAAGSNTDRSGPALVEALGRAGFTVAETRVVADDTDAIAATLIEMAEGFVGLVITTGGTGFAPRDRTPEATQSVIDRAAPGLAEAMRAVNPLGRLSRGVAGLRGACLIVNTPGSTKGAVESFDAIHDVLGHALALAAGEQPAH